MTDGDVTTKKKFYLNILVLPLNFRFLYYTHLLFCFHYCRFAIFCMKPIVLCSTPCIFFSNNFQIQGKIVLLQKRAKRAKFFKDFFLAF